MLPWRILTVNHDELIKRGFRWLINTKRCSVVVSELSAGSEIPDVIGWHDGWSSVLLEAKATLIDFKSDQNKFFRHYEDIGMGIQRYYIVPFDLGNDVIDILPDKWGLLLCRGNKVIIEKESLAFENNWRREMGMLISLMRRMGNATKPIIGVGVKWYKPLYHEDHVARAELFIEPETSLEDIDANS